MVESRAQARQLIAGHRVRVNGSFADKPARLVATGDSVELVGDKPRFVSRGGDKLDGALDVFGVDVRARRCLDAGASTGGFTDCLLQRGAAHVIAVDVGHGQLHESLVAHPEVTNMERTNIRHLEPAEIGGPVDLIVGDLSFISLRTVLPALVGLAASGADMVLLVKPQFEAGRAEASKGRGIIRDPVVWRRVLDEVAAAAAAVGAPVQQAAVSSIRGGDGNVEFLYHLVLGAEPDAPDLDALIESVEKTPGDGGGALR